MEGAQEETAPRESRDDGASAPTDLPNRRVPAETRASLDLENLSWYDAEIFMLTLARDGKTEQLKELLLDKAFLKRHVLDVLNDIDRLLSCAAEAGRSDRFSV